MAGYSKWSKVKHIKGVLNVKRGKLLSRLSKEITVAAKNGGGEASANPRLRSATLCIVAEALKNAGTTTNLQEFLKKSAV